jgi:hypothetical protein
MQSASRSLSVSQAFVQVDELRKAWAAAQSRRTRFHIHAPHPDAPTGVTIYASLATKTGAEFNAVAEAGRRFIEWSELDAMPSRLVELAAEAMAEVTAALAAAPPPAPRPSADCAAHDYPLDWEAHDALIRTHSDRLFDAGQAWRNERGDLPEAIFDEALAFGAVKAAARFAYLSCGLDEKWMLAELKREMRRQDDRRREEIRALLREPSAAAQLH